MESLSPKKPIRLDNVTCPYCGVDLTRETRNRDHVIGRRFLPRGMLENRWNLILWSCKDCNSWKANLEDDISAITLYPRVHGPTLDQRDGLIDEARRKARRSVSRKTGLPVNLSEEPFELELRLHENVRMTVRGVAPPQLGPERIAQLAAAHIGAFFFFLTYNAQLCRGATIPGEFAPLAYTFRGDWGSKAQTDFIDHVVGWEPRLLAGTAVGLFKIVIRRHPTAECWSWALEWNENLRTIGFFGDRQVTQDLIALFREPDMASHLASDGSTIVARVEQPLDPEKDRMFYWSDLSKSD